MLLGQLMIYLQLHIVILIISTIWAQKHVLVVRAKGFGVIEWIILHRWCLFNLRAAENCAPEGVYIVWFKGQNSLIIRLVQ